MMSNNQTTKWQSIETAPRCEVLLLAHFRSDNIYPHYAVQAYWGVGMPGNINCASYSGWFLAGIPSADPPRRRGVNIVDGILPAEGELAPTHWMRLPIEKEQAT